MVEHDGIPNLADVPISDPFAEKMAIEEERWLPYLASLAKTSKGFMTQESKRARIVEVYRLCFEESRDPLVLRHFVTHFPGLIFEATWFANLVKRAAMRFDLNQNAERNRIFRAISYGFRAASKPETLNSRSIKRMRLGGANLVRRRISQELSSWYKDLKLSDADRGWREKEIEKKAADLVKEIPKLQAHVMKLRSFLRRRRFYDAAVFCASQAFGVRVRTLEGIDKLL
jgi:hypothetical protein